MRSYEKNKHACCCLALALLPLSIATSTQAAVEINGECGAASGAVNAGATLRATQNYALCSMGAPSNLNIAGTAGPWSWTCVGTDGGWTKSCRSILSGLPTCGSANGAILSSAPTANLCAQGTASLITGNGPWSWVCGGVYGSPPVICNAQSSSDLHAAARSLDFTNNLGVNTHMGAQLGPEASAQLNKVLQNWAYLQKANGNANVGFNHMRNHALYNNLVQGLAALNTTSLISTYEPTTQDPVISKPWLDQYASFIDGVESPNEVDVIRTNNGVFSSGVIYGNLSGIPAGIAEQKALYSLMKSDPKLASIPIYNFTIANNIISGDAGNMNAYADYANLHAYAGIGRPPYTSVIPAISETIDNPGKPAIVGETGYPTIPPGGSITAATAGGPMEVSEEVQAKYMLSSVFDFFNAGVKRTYLYELYDDSGQPGGCDAANINKENHFGIFHCDWTPKPAATAFHNLIQIIGDTARDAGTFTPQPLAYTLTQTSTDPNMNASVFHSLLQKADGSYDLMLWAEPALWDAKTATEIPVTAPNEVTINLGNKHATFALYDPLTGILATAQNNDVGLVTVPVSDHPVIVEISAIHAAAARL